MEGVSRYGWVAIASMVASVILALSALFLPWFTFSGSSEVTWAPAQTLEFEFFRTYFTVTAAEGAVIEVDYDDDSDIAYLMNLMTVLIALWTILGLGFIYSVAREDAALGILTAGLLLFIGGISLFYFATHITEDAMGRAYDGLNPFWGESSLFGVSSTWHISWGWYILLLAFAIAFVGAFSRLYLDGRK